MQTLERIIADHPFFAGLDSQYTALLVGCASNVRFDPGVYIVREGDEANDFFLIRYGRGGPGDCRSPANTHNCGDLG